RGRPPGRGPARREPARRGHVEGEPARRRAPAGDRHADAPQGEGVIRTRAEFLTAVERRRSMRGEEIVDVDLSFVSAPHVSFRGATFRRCTMHGAHFDGASFRGARFLAVDGSEASFVGADLGELHAAWDETGAPSRFDEAWLERAALTGANLSGASLLRA